MTPPRTPRRLLVTPAVCGVLAVGTEIPLLLWAPVDYELAAWWLLAALALTWAVVATASWTAYRCGWADRDRQSGQVVGRWMAWDADHDGVPVAPPVQGVMLMDTPREVS